jgi:hypothetical protein
MRRDWLTSRFAIVGIGMIDNFNMYIFSSFTASFG